ncbi:ABC-type branched-subunit amino acid transport system permease subunit [Aeromicrobium sp. SORGH_AS981]|uniref:branched-chain amino acid ABC transporter permease n=1 Tax=Aeromicrobium sp. SORGH_AS_0981 TaxID=3041802 RepID=UPI002855B7DB|nr:branched-chain amino acid ABC transporter permease [Aeromicrobium sp. SORGH_AS_0981]MDR6119239.1 ABC-type branched-subunit amino acid transport system permease subunit [Aeromicrobium sp. SORGH_AS_0981]
MDFGTILNAALSQALGPQAIVFALAAIGLNIHFGYTGLLNFGQAGFMAVGAYGLAVTVVTYDQSFWLGVVVALLAPVVLALVLGVPTLRLRADYLAIATIATAEILRLVFGAVETKDVFGGSNGLTGFAKTFQDLNPYSGGVDFGVVRFRQDDLWSLTVGWILVARSAASSSGCSCAARGDACCARSARTRTPSARWARTCSPTRCRRSCWVVSSVVSPASSSH